METLELSRAELWFCAPNTPAVGEAVPFHLATAQGERHLWVRVVPSVLESVHENTSARQLFWQEEDARGKSAVMSDGTFYDCQEPRPDNGNWRRRLGRMIADRTCRVWRPEGDERFAVTFYNYGEAGIQSVSSTGNHFVTTGFSWQEEANADFASWPQNEFKTYFERQFQDETSPLRLAYEWHGWNEDQRTSHVTRCEWGTWDEMKSLAECVLQLTVQGEPEEPFWETDVWDLLDEDNTDPFRFHTAGELENQWARTFRHAFRPMILLNDRPSFIGSYLNAARFLIYPLFPRIAPSAHEKMEALFRLRDWALQHAPDEAARLLDFPL